MIELILAVSEEVLDVLEKRELADKINQIDLKLSELIAKSDQLITREIKASYEAIYDALLTASVQTKETRLLFAEENLLRNTKLNTYLQTENINNNYWICLSHIGLAIICSLRNDKLISCRHILHAFEMDRMTSMGIFPKFYEEIYRKEVEKRTEEWKVNKIKEIQNKDYSTDEFLGKAGAFLFGAGGIALAVLALGKPIVGKPVLSEAQKMWNNASSQRYISENIARIEYQMDMVKDHNCTQITKDYLKELDGKLVS
jgi:hypothetical protein